MKKKKEFNAEAQVSSLHWETPHVPHMKDLLFYRKVLSGAPNEIQNIVDHEVLHRLWELLGEDETKQTKLFSSTEKVEYHSFIREDKETWATIMPDMLNEYNMFELEGGGHIQDDEMEMMASLHNMCLLLEASKDPAEVLEGAFQRALAQNVVEDEMIPIVREYASRSITKLIMTLEKVYARRDATATPPQRRILAFLNQQLTVAEKAVIAWDDAR